MHRAQFLFLLLLLFLAGETRTQRRQWGKNKRESVSPVRPRGRRAFLQLNFEFPFVSTRNFRGQPPAERPTSPFSRQVWPCWRKL